MSFVLTIHINEILLIHLFQRNVAPRYLEREFVFDNQMFNISINLLDQSPEITHIGVKINMTLYLDTYFSVDFLLLFFCPSSVLFFIPYNKSYIFCRTAPHKTKKNKIIFVLICEVGNRPCSNQPTNFISLKNVFCIIYFSLTPSTNHSLSINFISLKMYFT